MTAGFSPLAWLGPGVTVRNAHGGTAEGGVLCTSTGLLIGTPVKKYESRKRIETLKNTYLKHNKPKTINLI